MAVDKLDAFTCYFEYDFNVRTTIACCSMRIVEFYEFIAFHVLYFIGIVYFPFEQFN